MIVTLTITKGKDAGRVVRLEEGETKTFGRGSQADVILSDVVVSRVHCRIRVQGGACYVQDMGSRNGTSVNGRTLTEEARLADDDALGIGTELAEVRITPDTSPAEEAVEPVIPVEVEEQPTARPEAAVADAGYELELQGDDERLLGTVVGGCRIEGLLGRDDISSVYRATQLSMERSVALKILSPAIAGDPRSKDRFIGAARAGGKLNHPNIVRVYDAGEENGLTFVAMEFVAGKSVRRLLGERERQPAAAAGAGGRDRRADRRRARLRALGLHRPRPRHRRHDPRHAARRRQARRDRLRPHRHRRKRPAAVEPGAAHGRAAVHAAGVPRPARARPCRRATSIRSRSSSS